MRSKAFGFDELVLSGIRLLAKQILGTVLDIEVDQSGSQANRRAHYKGEALGDNSDIGCVRATHPVPPTAGIYYFEVTIISQGQTGWISVGLCPHQSFLNALTGWQDGTFGYHGDDGKKFEGNGMGQHYGPTFTTGDVIGCAVNVEEGACAFTKNGLGLGIAFTGEFQIRY